MPIAHQTARKSHDLLKSRSMMGDIDIIRPCSFHVTGCQRGQQSMHSGFHETVTYLAGFWNFFCLGGICKAYGYI